MIAKTCNNCRHFSEEYTEEDDSDEVAEVGERVGIGRALAAVHRPLQAAKFAPWEALKKAREA